MYSAKTPGSSHGFRVVMPDFFRGKPVTPEKMALGMDKVLQWIGTVAVIATGKDSWYTGAALIHPSQPLAQVPILLLPFKDETDLCHYHGWAAARGNYADPLNKQRATEALQL
ncbi:hypothetical protein BC936DRAFT_143750 [Jimgerdemannia flammicorona]|uniref:Uncharacterized protein n=1 Tax=Jimgerdemannia flammicorona TaxID=994334 RepID=A0A433DDH9_9FUNG|nr:hypothetical protein BC936DRAFT_143750 [Jimgerdemannia flammicorona]